MSVSGWAVFLRRGMWAWIETCAPSPSGPPDPPKRVVDKAAGVDAEVVQVLAAMVLAIEGASDER